MSYITVSSMSYITVSGLDGLSWFVCLVRSALVLTVSPGLCLSSLVRSGSIERTVWTCDSRRTDLATAPRA